MSRPKSAYFPFLFLCLLFCVSCRNTRTTTSGKPSSDDGLIEVVFLQMNDVYEIAPLEGGKVGGMARVAAVKNKLRQQNPNTFAIMAGDFLNPSVIGNMQFKGKRIRGKQMVEVMNAAGLDLVTFGNHEFDLKENELAERMQESTFGWLSSNVLNKKGEILQPFISGPSSTPVPPAKVLDLRDRDGTAIKVGVLGVTLPSNPADYVVYKDVYQSAMATYDSLQKLTDYVVAITHLKVEDDIELCKRIPGVKLVMGGHDHDHMYHTVGNAYVAKADANAKTVYVHTLAFNKATKVLSIQSQLIQVDTTIAFEPSTAKVVDKWTTIAENSFKEQGFTPREVLFTAQKPLDGRESSIRHQQTNLGQLIAKAISDAAPQSEVALLNSGSIRVDDQLRGNITQYDILRTLPFGGKIVEAEMKGSLLEKVLNTGRTNKGTGGYLQLDKAAYNTAQNTWLISGLPLNPSQIYRVALTDFLLTGQEANLDFLTPDNPDITKIHDPTSNPDIKNDIRMAVIEYVKNQK